MMIRREEDRNGMDTLIINASTKITVYSLVFPCVMEPA